MTRHENDSSGILEEAMDWFLRLRSPDRDASDDRAFSSWLQQSTAHRDAWEKACRTWEVMGEVPPLQSDLQAGQHSAGMPAALRPRRRRHMPWITGTIAALAACLLLFVAGPELLLGWQADFRTATAELRKVTLEDGTVVELGPQSAIDTEFSDSARQVTLLSGEAFFDVSHQPERPFTVDAGGLKVTVIGTAFDIHMTPAETTVELARGIVGLSAAGSPQHGMELSPGDVVRLDRVSGQMAQSVTAPDDIGSWRAGRLFVNDVTIASVVEELQRYHPAWISIPNSGLAAQRVTGLYDLSDPDRALHALVEPYGGKVHRISPYLRVLSFF